MQALAIIGIAMGALVGGFLLSALIASRAYSLRRMQRSDDVSAPRRRT